MLNYASYSIVHGLVRKMKLAVESLTSAFTEHPILCIGWCCSLLNIRSAVAESYFHYQPLMLPEMDIAYIRYSSEQDLSTSPSSRSEVEQRNRSSVASRYQLSDHYERYPLIYIRVRRTHCVVSGTKSCCCRQQFRTVHRFA